MNRVASVIKLDYARKQGLTGKNVGIAVMDPVSALTLI